MEAVAYLQPAKDFHVLTVGDSFCICTVSKKSLNNMWNYGGLYGDSAPSTCFLSGKGKDPDWLLLMCMNSTEELFFLLEVNCADHKRGTQKCVDWTVCVPHWYLRIFLGMIFHSFERVEYCRGEWRSKWRMATNKYQHHLANNEPREAKFSKIALRCPWWLSRPVHFENVRSHHSKWWAAGWWCSGQWKHYWWSGSCPLDIAEFWWWQAANFLNAHFAWIVSSAKSVCCKWI